MAVAPAALAPPAASCCVWIAVSRAAAHPDYLAYFNELARRASRAHPGGFRSRLGSGHGAPRRRSCSAAASPYLHMACLYTGDDTRLGLPAWDSLEPYQPVTGWVAVSQTMLKNYGWMVAQQRGRPDLAFAWLDQYQPVAKVGKSILLYNIPDSISGARR